MNPINRSGQLLYIHRHCIQNLLHEALISESKPCGGLLAGGENMIESMLPVTHFVNNSAVKLTQPAPEKHHIMGVYLSSQGHDRADPELIRKLSELCESLTGSPPAYYLLLDLGELGRMDAQLYSDRELTRPATLNMLEERSLYPDSSNR